MFEAEVDHHIECFQQLGFGLGGSLANGTERLRQHLEVGGGHSRQQSVAALEVFVWSVMGDFWSRSIISALVVRHRTS